MILCIIIVSVFVIAYRKNFMHNQTAILFFYKGKKMKLLSFAIPCYNSKDYMEHCIESILPGGDDVEIIIVDDGSKDETAAIADRYAAEYPDIVKAVHQENGGHGEAVNTGLKNATGKYFKVVDSDDWVDLESYRKILDKLREFEQENTQIDMLLANYVYEKEGARRKKVMRQTGFPRNEIFTWSDIKHIHKGHYILMHSVIYRTELLRSFGLELPKHTFYVDNIYVYKPLPYVRTMYSFSPYGTMSRHCPGASVMCQSFSGTPVTTLSLVSFQCSPIYEFSIQIFAFISSRRILMSAFCTKSEGWALRSRCMISL